MERRLEETRSGRWLAGSRLSRGAGAKNEEFVPECRGQDSRSAPMIGRPAGDLSWKRKCARKWVCHETATKRRPKPPYSSVPRRRAFLERHTHTHTHTHTHIHTPTRKYTCTHTRGVMHPMPVRRTRTRGDGWPGCRTLGVRCLARRKAGDTWTRRREGGRSRWT
ncbi:hypothetical protein LY76DRAFT_263766 [Colletotrichum caudatum]|nr:hypothetical protein LY76DRAFT_263766 [Colletotrichum caudatum]